MRTNGQLAMSRPCHHCHAALIAHGIKAVVYSTDSGVVKVRL